ncbi:ribonuclease domain-containing protein [Actinocatenispora rupis]|uniref:Ribonuclease n=1 Tax=Actinocatenispora rupis TaxID=519421 RepID=A0A8J3NHH7_9ACTN|nr:ribonuclease domain-containing protein [Actinocatenispora rupis]GID15974.1 ribonuclease [Actinocatenispora rupis]
MTTHALTLRRVLATSVAALAGVFAVGAGVAQAHPAPVHAAPVVARAAAPADISDCTLSSLPAQATDTVNLIHSNGPFPYPDNDGVVFDNREGVLPAESAGYYHEYTVITPGSPNRGTRRIVTGGTPITSPPHYYYTGDHYSTFCEITDASGGGGGGGVQQCTDAPSQVQDTIDLVEAGGPFPYSQDGTVYQNREGVLPAQSADYYHLYVVPTPGDSTAGNRRLVHGSGSEYYYTPDNYGSFCQVS